MSKKAFIVVLALSALYLWTGIVAATAETKQKSVDAGDIRSVDFANFSYDLRGTACDGTLGSSTIKVRNGEFGDWSDEAFGVRTEDTIYGDLTGDGHNEAIVIIVCGGMHALEQPLVYTMKSNDVRLLTTLEIGDRAFGGLVDKGLKIQDGLLTVERMQGKAACCPEYIEKKTYRWNGKSLVQVGKIERRKFIDGQ